jgi:hypothetical protein
VSPARTLLAACCIVIALITAAAADPAALLRGLDTDDPAALSAAIATIERAPAEPGLADVLFAAGRACEDRLYDPARALALYDRIAREMPNAGVSIAAERRARVLRPTASHAREASELATLMATADTLPPAEIDRRADALVTAPWPGALDAALWRADWLCRTGRFDDADVRYRELVARATGSPQAAVARRNAAGCAIDAKRWSRAEQLARALPAGDPVDAAVRSDLLDAAHTGRRRDQLYVASFVVAILAALALVASLVEAALRGGRRRPALQPPVEVMYIAPVAAIVIAAAFAIDRVIAPAVVRISVAGLLMSWLSGATLDLLRVRSRELRLRAVLHVITCMLGVLAIGYIAIMRDGLIDMFSETVRFGPGD